MKTPWIATLGLLSAAATFTPAVPSTAPAVAGDYLEVRSCDVYTGPCFANAEMGLSGKECIMVWSIREGIWNEVTLDGLRVIAVVHANNTLGDLRYEKRRGKAVLIVDGLATSQQREALTAMVRALSGDLIQEVVRVESAPIESSIGTCHKSGCAQVKAGQILDVSTRCLGDKDHLCGNEETYYPPLTAVNDAQPAFTELAAFRGEGLNMTWQSTDQRSAFIATFAH